VGGKKRPANRNAGAQDAGAEDDKPDCARKQDRNCDESEKGGGRQEDHGDKKMKNAEEQSQGTYTGLHVLSVSSAEQYLKLNNSSSLLICQIFNQCLEGIGA
jgi:hypothetical protein